MLWGFEAPRIESVGKRNKMGGWGESVGFSKIDPGKFNTPPTHARDDETFLESSEV
jgi:hypothetical protein